VIRLTRPVPAHGSQTTRLLVSFYQACELLLVYAASPGAPVPAGRTRALAVRATPPSLLRAGGQSGTTGSLTVPPALSPASRTSS
jgi:hypothetical protein